MTVRDANMATSTYHAITEAELAAFVHADAAGFGESAEELAKHHPRWNALELDRTRAAFHDDEIVGTSRNYSLELTRPGGAPVPAAGVAGCGAPDAPPPRHPAVDDGPSCSTTAVTARSPSRC